MTATQPHFTLNNGVTLPQIGFGVYQTPPEETMVAFEKASAKLGLEQIDLLILHQANPTEFDKTIGSYNALKPCLPTESCALSASATSCRSVWSDCSMRPRSSPR